MFGLMRPVKKCNSSSSYSNKARMHYCGTCKTIGQEFGQSSRMLLNYDAVFLAELLTILAAEDTNNWNAALQATNKCFRMPAKSEESPVPLRYAAATNVFLAALKTDDNIRDKGAKRHKLLRWFLSSSFKKSARQLAEFGLDIDFFWQQVELQQVLEAEKQVDFANLADLFAHYAAPTVAMTAALFERAAVAIARPAYTADLAAIGGKLGLIVYALDAFEDLAADIYEQQFNPLAAHFGLTAGALLSEDILDSVRGQILAFQADLALIFANLGIDEAHNADFVARLTSNLAIRLYQAEPQALRAKLTVAQKVKARWASAKTSAFNIICQPDSWAKKLQFQALSVLFFALPMLSVESTAVAKGQLWSSMAIMTGILAALGLWRLPITPVKKKKRSLKSRLLFWRKNEARAGGKMCDYDDFFDCDGCCERCWLGLLVVLAVIGVIIFFIYLIVGGYWLVLGLSLAGIGLIIGVGLIINYFSTLRILKNYAKYELEREKAALVEEEAKKKALAEKKMNSDAFFAKNATRPEVKTLPNGLQYEVINAGSFDKVRKPQSIVIYTKWSKYNDEITVEAMPYFMLKKYSFSFITSQELDNLLTFEDTELKFYVPFELSSRPNFQEYEPFEIKVSTNPNIFTTASGLQYQIVNEGDDKQPATSTQILEYEKDCQYYGNLQYYNKGEKSISAPNWFVAGSFEAEAYALMPKNVGAIYEFFLPNSNYEKLDFRIKITDKSF